MRCVNSCFQPNGLTLIEVVAGLTLLSLLLVGTMLGFGRLDQQIRLADRKLEACAAADQLLSAWLSNPEVFPMDEHGPVPGRDSLGWYTQVLESSEVFSLNVTIVRLIIVDGIIMSRDEPALATVDVMLALPLWKHGKR